MTPSSTIAGLTALLVLISPSHTEVSLLEVRDPAGQRVRLVIAVFSGSTEDPAGREGAAALTARALAPQAPEIAIDVDKDASRFTCEAAPADFDAQCSPLLDALARPAWDPGRIDTARRALVEALDALRSSDALIQEAFDALAFRGGSRAHPAAGTSSGLAALSQEDLSAFMAAQYRKGNVVAGLSGPTTPAMLARVRDGLAPLPDGPPQHARKPLTYLARPRALLVEVPAARPRCLAGVPLPVRRAHPDYVALWVASTPVQGAETLREASAFAIELPFAEAAPDGLESQVSKVISWLGQGPDDAAIQSSADKILGALSARPGGADVSLMDQIEDLQWRTPGFLDRLPESLRAASGGAVRDAMKRHVPGSRLAIVAVVPDAARFLESIPAGTAAPLGRDDFEMVKPADLFR